MALGISNTRDMEKTPLVSEVLDYFIDQAKFQSFFRGHLLFLQIERLQLGDRFFRSGAEDGIHRGLGLLERLKCFGQPLLIVHVFLLDKQSVMVNEDGGVPGALLLIATLQNNHGSAVSQTQDQTDDVARVQLQEIVDVEGQGQIAAGTC